MLGFTGFGAMTRQDFLRHEQETLKANASQIDQALQALDPVQCTLGPLGALGHWDGPMG
jgi:hypothetical protein